MFRCTATASTLVLVLAGCSGVPVNVSAPQPIKVDINMKLDVYQHGDSAVQKKIVSAAADVPVDVQARRKNRMGEIQILKNARAIGENHLGMLEIKEMPPGEYGAYAKDTVDAENTDRMSIMQQISKKEILPLAKVQEQQGQLAFKLAFNGEWIEPQQPDGNFKWVQKGE